MTYILIVLGREVSDRYEIPVYQLVFCVDSHCLYN